MSSASAKIAPREGVRQSVQPLLTDGKNLPNGPYVELGKVRNSERRYEPLQQGYVDVSRLVYDHRGRGNASKLQCPECGQWRSSLIVTSRGMGDSRAYRTMCATCDRSRK